MTIVRLAVDLVLQAGATMRGTASGLALVAERLGLDLKMPSFGAVRSWLLRLGCYALTCALPIGEWVLLIDHTVQIGPCKLLVIVGCPLATAPLGERPLRQSDLHLVGMAMMEHSTDETVAAELQKAAQRVGKVCQIVSDNGSDLNGGVKRFQQQHEGVTHTHDVAHKAGVKKGDWLVGFDGRSDLLRETDLLAYSIREKKPGDEVTLTANEVEGSVCGVWVEQGGERVIEMAGQERLIRRKGE